MTVTTTIVGLLPILWGTWNRITGYEKRIAAPMVGGMVTSTISNLISDTGNLLLMEITQFKKLKDK